MPPTCAAVPGAPGGAGAATALTPLGQPGKPILVDLSSFRGLLPLDMAEVTHFPRNYIISSYEGDGLTVLG